MAGQAKPPKDGADGHAFSQGDSAEIEQRARLNTPKIYEILRREGEEEMERPAVSLWWSGVAAGLSMSLSLLTQTVLQSHLPDTAWRPLVTSLGYTTGFLVAVLARHQLFTENTITAVLPVASELTLRNLLRMGRLWGVVLAANFAGTLAAALFYFYAPVIDPGLRGAMLEIAHHALEPAPAAMFFKAIGAGFIIAAMVWLMPSAQTTQLHVIVLMTYLIAAAGFAHIVAGSLEAFMLVLDGRLALWPMLSGFVAPTLAGNIIGGTLLFALISYGQVAKEM